MKRANLDQIKAAIHRHSSFLRHAYNVEKIGVFGSVAMGQNTETSDIDVLVDLSKPIGFFKFIELEEFLSKVLGKNVDLVTQKALKPTIKEDILRELIYV